MTRGSDPNDTARYLDAFVGREAELRAIDAHLARGERLVTLVGPPGVGKTRLAAEFLRARAEAAPSRACFCDLTEARTVEDVCRVVAPALGAALGAFTGAALVDAVAAALRHAAVDLIVLDNFEHLVELTPDTVARWLARAPAVRWLVTSRERLRVPGEVSFELAPLDVPADADDSLGAPATQLLLERVRRARHDYDPPAAERAALAEIARQMDGLPLALELAAARVAVLGAGTVVAQLARRLDLLTHGARGAAARQATLRAALEWSWALLAPTERAALAQCTVFRGGFAFEALEAVLVLAPSDSTAAPPPAFELLQALRDKSLLRADGAGRFGLYLNVRTYAATHLPPDAARDAAARHAAYYARAALRWVRELDGPRGPLAHGALLADRDNLHAVVDWALAAPDAARLDCALAALVALDAVVWERGPAGPHLAALERALAAAAHHAVDPALHALALNARGACLRGLGRADASAEDHRAAIARGQAAGDARVEAAAWRNLGATRARQGRADEAVAALEQACALLAAPELAGDEAKALHELGATLFHLHRPADAARALRRALDACRAAGNARREPLVLNDLAYALVALEREGEAEQYLAQALARRDVPADAMTHGATHGALATLRHAQGRLADARAHYAVALRAARDRAQRHFEAVLAGRDALARVELGELDAAGPELDRARALASAAGDAHRAALLEAFRGGLCAQRGDALAAEDALERAEAALVDADPCARAAAALQRVPLDLLAARRASAAGERRAAREHLARARARLRAAEAETSAARGLDARLALRLATRALEAFETAPDGPADAPPPPPPPPTSSDRPELVVHARGHWLALPSGARVRCRHRSSLRTILLALAQQRLAAPGVSLDKPALLAAGWPGQRILAEAADSRLRVALSTLRKLGLRPYLLKDETGYLLDPAVPLRVVT